MKDLAMAIVLKNEKVLVQERYRPSKGMVFEFPGGSVDEGETGEEAAIRELWEETGLKGLEVLGSTTLTNGFGGEIHYVVLEAESGSTPVAVDPIRKQSFYWYELDEIPLADFYAADLEFIKSDLAKYLLKTV